MNVNPQHIEGKRLETLLWRQEVIPKFEEWYSEMNQYIPSAINKMSVQDLVRAGFSKVLATRLLTKRCLWFIKMAPDIIRKIHYADFRDKYSYQSQNLDIVELPAIYVSLPLTFENDAKGDTVKF